MADKRLDYLAVPGATGTDDQYKAVVSGFEEVIQTTYLTHPTEGDVKIVVRRQTDLGTVKVAGSYVGGAEFHARAIRAMPVLEFDPNALAYSVYRWLDGLAGRITAIDIDLTFTKYIPEWP